MLDDDIGSLSEDFVQAVAERAFSADFVFRSPSKPDGKEVTDVLVLFDDFALVIQAKAQRPGPSGTGYADPSLEWAKKNLARAVRQVGGAIRTIREGRLEFFKNERLGRVTFNRANYPFLYGVVLLDHESEPYNPIDLVPALSDIPAPIHVLSHRDFFRVAQLLDTPMDLINYLEARTDVLLPTLRSIKVHEEAVPMRYYLGHLEKIVRLRSEAHGDPITEEDIRQYASNLRMLATDSLQEKKYGIIIDHLIERLHECESQGGSTTVYVRAATELGRLPRGKRIDYGKRYSDASMKAAHTRKRTWVRIYNRRRSLCLILLASPLPRTERARRAKELGAIAHLAKAYHEVRCAIGIATEAGAEMGSSYDVALKESSPVSDPEAKVLGREIFEQPEESSA